MKRSISSRSFLVVLCLSSVDCGVSLLLSSGWGEESGDGSLVTSVTGGGAGGKGFALGLGCLVMEVEGRCTLGSAKKKQSKRATFENSLSTHTQKKVTWVWETEWLNYWIIKTGVTWGWGRFGRVCFLGSLFWGLSSRSFKQLTLHVSFLHIATGLAQNNYTIQHFQCYQPAESNQTIKKLKLATTILRWAG